AGLGFEDAEGAEAGDGLAEGDAADPELFDQGALAGEAPADGPLSAADASEHLLNDLVPPVLRLSLHTGNTTIDYTDYQRIFHQCGNTKWSKSDGLFWPFVYKVLAAWN